MTRPPLIEVTSARHGRATPIHLAYRTGNGLVAACPVGAGGLMPLRTDFGDKHFSRNDPDGLAWDDYCFRCLNQAARWGYRAPVAGGAA